MEGYYTPEKTREVLGNITPNALRNYVNRGKLHRMTPPGKRQAYYLITEVEDLKREMQEFYAGKTIIGKDKTNGRPAHRQGGSPKATRR